MRQHAVFFVCLEMRLQLLINEATSCLLRLGMRLQLLLFYSLGMKLQTVFESGNEATVIAFFMVWE